MTLPPYSWYFWHISRHTSPGTKANLAKEPNFADPHVNLQVLDKKYIRDKRSPTPKDANVSKVMSSNRPKNSKPEMCLRKGLWSSGVRGYRIHYKRLLGKPDITFISKKIAIFVHGCYWHRCPYCKLELPKHNTSFWKQKFEQNVKRDNKKTEQLKKMNWEVITLWECEIHADLNKCLQKINNILETNRIIS